MRAEKRRAGRAIRKRRRIRNRVTAAALAAGIDLLPWQLEYLTACLLGEWHVARVARRAGRATGAEVWHLLTGEWR